MKTKLMNILIAVQALAGLAMLGAVKIWAPVCGKMLDLANGNQTHMKCHWAGQAGLAVAVILLIAALMALLAKKEYKGFMVVTAVCGALLFVIFATSFIGVCASETMRCQVTKVWGLGTAAVAFAASLINLLSGKEGQVPG